MLRLLEDAAANTGNGASSYILIGGLLVVVIGMFIWSSVSNKKKQKQAQEMVNSLKKGDRVKTIGGICGFVVEINNEENTFVLETGSADKKSYVKFDKGAIYQTAPAEGTIAAAKAEAKKETEKAEEVKEEDKEVEKTEEKSE